MIARLFRVNPEERQLAAWVAALFIVTVAGLSLGANAADALFFLRFGVEFLPLLITISGLVVMFGTLAYAAGLGRFESRKWLPWVAAALGALILVERIALSSDIRSLYPAIWLTEQLTIILTFTLMWNAAAEACHPRQAKRLFPLFASAGILGGILGNLVTGPLATLLGTDNLLVLHSALLGASSVLVLVIGRRFFGSRHKTRSGSVIEDLKAGYDATRRTPMLAHVALIGALLSILFYMVVFPFSESVANEFETEAAVAGYLGAFASIATTATLIVSLFLANRLFTWLGVVATMAIVPIVYLIGFSSWLISFTLLTASIVRGMQWVAVNAIGGTAWSALFNVVPVERRSQVMAFINGVPAELGVTASGLLLIATAGLAPTARIITGLVVAAGASVLVWRMRPLYGKALVEALREGLVEVFTATTTGMQKVGSDADAVEALARTLSDDRPGMRRVAADTLGRIGEPRAAKPLMAVAEDQDPEVRTAAVRALGNIASSEALGAVAAALRDDEPAVRRVAIDALDKAGDYADTIALCLEDPDAGVRAVAAASLWGNEGKAVIEDMLSAVDPIETEAALRALKGHPTHATAVEPERLLDHDQARVRQTAAQLAEAMGQGANWPQVIPLLSDPSPSVRRAAGLALRQMPAASKDLARTLNQGGREAQDAALIALVDHPEASKEVVEWAAHQVDEAVVYRNLRLGVGTGWGYQALGYLGRVAAYRESRLERLAVTALGAARGSDAAALLVKGTVSSDVESRSYAFEALEAIGDHTVTKRLLPLLESSDQTARVDLRATLHGAIQHRDPWIRALAAAGLTELLETDWLSLLEHASTDETGLMQDALERARIRRVADTLDTMGTVERVLALQSVPMFAELEPADLERIAGISEERRIQEDEFVYREGRPGDSMMVITSGQVRVTKETDKGTVTIRTYSQGEHIGELALLRGSPRAADVAADGGPVRGLVLAADRFHAIIEERPEVALAMLGTLAERLGTII